jgi:hypothetical protein
MNPNVANGKTWQEWTLRTSSDEMRQVYMAGALNVMSIISSGPARRDICTCGQARYKPLLLQRSGDVAATSYVHTHTHNAGASTVFGNFRFNYCNR